MAQQQAVEEASFPLDGTPLEWTSERNQVLVNGRPFRIKGLNWFGFETEVSSLAKILSRLLEGTDRLTRPRPFIRPSIQHPPTGQLPPWPVGRAGQIADRLPGPGEPAWIQRAAGALLRQTGAGAR